MMRAVEDLGEEELVQAIEKCPEALRPSEKMLLAAAKVGGIVANESFPAQFI